MATKETLEGLIAINETANSVKQSFDNNGKLDFSDIGFFIDDIKAWQDAVENLLVRSEAQTVSNTEVTDMFNTVESRLSAFSPDDRYDIRNIEQGFYCLFRMITRKAYQKGVADGRVAALREAKM